MRLVAVASAVLAAVPAALIVVNLFLYRRSPRVRRTGGARPRSASAGIRVVIPARNEQRTIRAAVESVLANRDVQVEVVVVDDASQDDTAAIVRELARRDARVRLEEAPALPEGWNGKQHACLHGARGARVGVVVFLDADVRLSPDALVRVAAFLDRSRADLVSGIPRQVTGTLFERLVIPLIHFVLLGYLPMVGMRRSTRPAFAAGCGQLFAARREAYEAVGGHGAVRSSRHDGITLPRAFRAAGRRTDLFDATDVARCRMYRSAREVWHGLAKNATEGMAAPRAIGAWTVLLLGGHVLPFVLVLAAGVLGLGEDVMRPAAAAAAIAWITRLILAGRFRQSIVGAVLHPAGVALLLAVQWAALAGSMTGRRLAWKGRTQS